MSYILSASVAMGLWLFADIDAIVRLNELVSRCESMYVADHEWPNEFLCN